MKRFNVKIISQNYNLRYEADLLADNSKQAESMAGEDFHKHANGFFSKPIFKRDTVTQIDKTKLLERATVMVIEQPGPQILNSSWDLKNK